MPIMIIVIPTSILKIIIISPSLCLYICFSLLFLLLTSCCNYPQLSALSLLPLFCPFLALFAYNSLPPFLLCPPTLPLISHCKPQSRATFFKLCFCVYQNFLSPNLRACLCNVILYISGLGPSVLRFLFVCFH